MAAPTLSISPVLIIGDFGFFGRNMNTERNRIPTVIYHTANITSANAVDRVMQEAKPRVIFHTASPDPMVILPKVFEDVNVGGTRNLLFATCSPLLPSSALCKLSSILLPRQSSTITSQT